MSVEHPPQQDFALYVMGALEGAALAQLTQHVCSCEPCAARLAAEARFETQLWELAAHAAEKPSATRRPSTPLPCLPPPPSASFGRRQLMFPAFVMLAASLALIAGLGRMIGEPRTRERGATMSPSPPAELPITLFSEETFDPEASAVCRAPARTNRALIDHAPAAEPLGEADEFRTCFAPAAMECEEDPPITPVVAACDSPR